MSSGLVIDQNCTSLAIPKLFPKVGKPQILIHKLDSTPAISTNMASWDCFWYQGLAQDKQECNDIYFKSTGTTYKVRRGMRIDTYC
jgi:hypothetical protein